MIVICILFIVISPDTYSCMHWPLLDETNFTRNDLHVWLAPNGRTMNPPHAIVASITIVFTSIKCLSLVRIWNYNKSRTHCFRGVKKARLNLDNRMIFEGEVRIAPGVISNPEECSEAILFTTNSGILDKISLYDSEKGYQVHF